jgi:ribose transport system permease protein
MESESGSSGAPPADSPEQGRPDRAAARGRSTSTSRSLAARTFSGGNLERWALVFAWAVVVGIFSLAEPSTYFTSGNFQTIFGSQAVLLMLALGLVLPLTTGDFDLSIASNLSLSAMLIAVLNTEHGVGIVAAILIGIAASTALGVLNGGLVVLIGIDSFIVTLGTGTLALGVVQWISNSNDITGISGGLTTWTIGNQFLGFPLIFYYGIAATLILFYVFEFTPLGRRLLFVGRGRTVSRLSGLRVTRIRWGSFIVCGFIAGIAGAMYAGSLGGADPASGQTFLLPAFAACFLGATAIQPGRFNAIGTFIAVYFLVSGITGLQLLGVQNFVQQLFYGGALVIAVALSQIVRRRGGSGRATRA